MHPCTDERTVLVKKGSVRTQSLLFVNIMTRSPQPVRCRSVRGCPHCLGGRVSCCLACCGDAWLAGWVVAGMPYVVQAAVLALKRSARCQRQCHGFRPLPSSLVTKY